MREKPSLNEQYFETKKNYKENLKKTPVKMKILNLLILFVLLYLTQALQKQCQRKIEMNKTKQIKKSQIK